MVARAQHTSRAAVWFARLAVGGVCLANLSAALPFLLAPARYAAAFELSGEVGIALVRGIGVLFLMWNVAYPPVIAAPQRNRLLFALILVQQLVGILGEGWIAVALPAGHAALRATGSRFLLFDAGGLAVMALAFALLHRRKPR